MTQAPQKAEQDLVTLTIDGFEISVPKGTLIIRAAEQLGIQIPRFCDHPLLDPAGACRQCLVEVTDMGNGRGMPKPQASCTTTVMPGMVVKTQLTSAVADKAQQGVMELLLINHPLDCPICDKGGECPLQNQAMSNGRGDSRFRDVKRTWPKPIAISPNVLLDRERCVSCQRCTRFADQIAGDPLIGLLERGWQQEIGTSEDVPFQSYYSGNTVQICPVGALTGASYRFRARPFDLMSTPSVCEHCSSGCAQRSDWRRGKVTRRMAGEDPAVNEEWNCDKGRWAFGWSTQPDRLLAPMIRNESGQLVETSWPAALEYAATGLREAADRGGVGVLPGGRLTQEDAYAYAKFARVVLGTNDIDFRARPGSDEELDFLASHVAGVTPDDGAVTYADLEYAPAVLLVAFEPEEESPIVFLRLRKATRDGRTAVHSIAPFASNGLVKLGGELHQAIPGGEAAAVSAFDTKLLPAGSVILVGERAATSRGTLSAVATLAGRSGARVAWVPRRAGDRGAVDVGALPTLLPGGRLVADDAARVEVERIWDASVPTLRGRDAAEIIVAAASGGIAALVVGGVDPADLPDPALAATALERVGFLVSLEVRAGAVTEHADVVLPVAPPAEKAGQFVDWEGRARPFVRTLITTSISDARVLDALAEELDADLGLGSDEAILAEIAKLGVVTKRAAAPAVAPRAVPTPGPGQAILASWHELLDAGRMQDGDVNLANTAKPARALLASDTAEQLGVRDGDRVTVSTDQGAITVPAAIGDLPAGVIWLPANARGAALRPALGVSAGEIVNVATASAPASVLDASPAAAAEGGV